MVGSQSVFSIIVVCQSDAAELSRASVLDDEPVPFLSFRSLPLPSLPFPSSGPPPRSSRTACTAENASAAPTSNAPSTQPTLNIPPGNHTQTHPAAPHRTAAPTPLSTNPTEPHTLPPSENPISPPPAPRANAQHRPKRPVRLQLDHAPHPHRPDGRRPFQDGVVRRLVRDVQEVGAAQEGEGQEEGLSDRNDSLGGVRVRGGEEGVGCCEEEEEDCVGERGGEGVSVGAKMGEEGRGGEGREYGVERRRCAVLFPTRRLSVGIGGGPGRRG